MNNSPWWKVVTQSRFVVLMVSKGPKKASKTLNYVEYACYKPWDLKTGTSQQELKNSNTVIQVL